MFKEPGTAASCTPPTVSLLFSVTGIRSCPDFYEAFLLRSRQHVNSTSVDPLFQSVHENLGGNLTDTLVFA